MILKRSYILPISLFFISFILVIISTVTKSLEAIYVSTPLVFISLIILYITIVKRVNKYFILYLITVFIAEVLFLFKENFLLHSLSLFIISQIILIGFVISFKHIKYLAVLYYFIPTVVFYTVVCHYAVDSSEKNFLFVILGFVNSILVSGIMVNYLRKMYWANYFLFLGAAFLVLNNAIVSLDIFNSNTNIFALLTNVISDLFICISFIVRVNSPAKKNRKIASY